jgi:6-phosphofructokinase
MPSVESMPFFSIGYPDKERVEVTLLGPPSNPKSEGYDWVKALVQVAVGAFKGKLEIYICVSDMIRFKEQLEPVYRNLEGVAEFKTIEDQLAIKIEVDKLGHVQASGFILDDFDSGNRLDFNINYDQTLLWHTILQLTAR